MGRYLLSSQSAIEFYCKDIILRNESNAKTVKVIIAVLLYHLKLRTCILHRLTYQRSHDSCGSRPNRKSIAYAK